MARPSKSVDLILVENNSNHRTKAEIEARKTAEKALYTGEKLRENRDVRESPIAHKEFCRLKKLYEKIGVVDALDQQGINRYCLEVAAVAALNYQLAELQAGLAALDITPDTEPVRLRYTDLIVKTTDCIRKAGDGLLKYEDRLLLNPAGRLRAIPKKPEAPAKQGGIAAYRAARAAGNV